MNHHTPGPWIVESDGVSVAMGGQVVIVAPAPGGAGRDVERANARLIAAAPAMLDALRALIFAARIDHLADADGAWRQLIASAEGALAKAEGKS